MLQRRLGVSRDVAEDAAAFAWLQLIRSRSQPNNIVGWLCTVAKHEALAAIRDQARLKRADDCGCEVAEPDQSEILEARQAVRFIQRLQPAQRTVLHLQLIGLSNREISERTGRSYTWVNRQLGRGRRTLRRFIEEDEGA